MRPLWLVLLSLSLGAGVSPAKEELARASTALLAGDTSAVATLEALYAQRPWDDDVAYWLARARYEAARCEEAQALLMGRDGVSWPAWRMRTLEAYSLVCLGNPARAAELLRGSLGQIDDRAERRRAAGVLGLLEVAEGAPTAASRLLEAGGDPALVVEPSLRAKLPEAIAAPVLSPVAGSIFVQYDRRSWRLEIATGLARPMEPPPLPAQLPSDGAPRGEPRACGADLVWSSPAEPLAEGRAGVFRLRRGQVTRLLTTPAGAVDDSPSCAGDALWLVRNVAGTSYALRVEGEQIDTFPSALALVSVDARPDGSLLVGAVSGGRPGVWYAAPGGWPPSPLVGGALDLVQPRWAP